MALAPGSAAVCAASASDASSAGVTADQRGFEMDPSCASGSVDAGSVQTNQYRVNTLTDQIDTLTNCVSPATTCSLRDAIGLANVSPGDITFLAGLTSVGSPGTINLGSPAGTNTALPALIEQENIIGPGANQLTVSGNNSTAVGSVFTINSGATATIYGITVSGGNSSNNGGGIVNSGTLTLTGSTVSSNTAAIAGGGIDNSGMLTLTGSTVSGNAVSTNDPLANPQGGGIFDATGAVIAANSIVGGNSVSETASAFNADIRGSYIDNGGNIADNSNSATSPYATTLQLSPLQYNGIGATVQTMIPLPGSPAICAGKASNIPSGVTTDERGYPNTATYSGFASNPCVDSGAVQTNYTGVGWVQQPPASTYANANISPAPTVEVLETDTLLSSNNTDAVNGVPVAIRLNGPGALGGTLTQATSGGVATYGDLSPADAAMGDTLETSPITVVSGVTLPAVTSNTFNVIGTISQFAVSATTPTVAGTPFTVTVTAEDAAGNTVTNFTGLLTISSSDGSIAESPLAGFVAVTNGVGTFQATLHVAGNQTISVLDTAAFPPISGISGTIAVSAGPAANLAAAAGASQSAYVNVAFATSLTGRVTDAYGNPVSGETVNFTAPASGASAALSPPNCATDATGACSVTATANGTAGSYDVTAAVSGLSGNVSYALTNNPMPSYIVTTTADVTDSTPDCTSGTGSTCSLRDAITAANAAGAGNITFVSSLTSTTSPGTITLGAGAAGDIALPAITGHVNITGPGANQLTVSGNNDRNVGSVFTVNSGAHVTLSGLTVSHGNSGSWAGGIYNNGFLTVTDSAISGNSSISGAGIYNPRNAALSIIGSILSANSANGGTGGGGIFNDGSLTIADSTITGNTVSSVGPYGGGIYSSSTFTLTNSTVDGNSITCVPFGCNAGAGIYTGASGGGIFLAKPSLAVIAANSIVAQNSASAVAPATSFGADVGGGTITDNGGNLIGTSTTGTSNLNPMLAPLGNYGGPTQTMLPLPGSAAICAGLAASIPNGVTADQRGEPNKNTTYTGYSAGTPCVDAGAVQTDYALRFTTNPASTEISGVAFPAAVTVSESGAPFTVSSVSIPVTLNGGATLVGSPVSAGTSAGIASYSLTVTNPTAVSNLQLGAGLTLNGAVAATTASSSFGLAEPVPTSLTPTVTPNASFVYNNQPTISAAVSPAAATGTLTATLDGSTALTVTPGAAGSFSIALPGTPLTVGNHTIALAFTGTAGYEASTGNIDLTVTTPALVVNNTGDSGAGASDCTFNPTGSGAGACTLRDALAAAANAGGASITFDPSVFGTAQTITLTSGTLTIPSHTTMALPHNLWAMRGVEVEMEAASPRQVA